MLTSKRYLAGLERRDATQCFHHAGVGDGIEAENDGKDTVRVKRLILIIGFRTI